MKIALTSRGVNKSGGISRYMTELAERLSKKHDIHLYSTFFKDIKDKNITLHKVPTFLGAPLVIESIPFTVHNSINLNIFNDFDIVHSNGSDCIPTDIVTAHSIHKAGIKFRKDFKGVKGFGFHDVYALTCEYLLYKRHNYKKVICDSNSSKIELIESYNVPKEDIEVIPIGINLDEFYYSPKSLELTKKYKLNGKEFLIGTVATEFYRKGVDLLIKAIYILIKKGYNVKLIIVGSPSIEGTMNGDIYYRNLATSLNIANNVVFTGKVSNLNKYYNLFDCYVSPSRYDAFNIPLLEAAASELPVITTNIAAAEHLKHEHSALYLNNPNDVQEIADKIEYLILNPELRLQFGRNARKDVSVCSWDNVVKRTEKLYETLK